MRRSTLLAAAVQASSGFTPASVSGLHAWWKADAITGLSDNATISSWSDSSGNSRTLTASGNPTYQTNELNSLPAVRLDGSGDYLANAGFSLSQASTWFVVTRRANVAGASEVLLASGSSVDVAVYLESDKDLGAWAGAGPLLNGNIGTAAHVVEVVFNGSSTMLGLDGTLSTGNAGTTGLTGLNVGTNRNNSGEYYTGDLFEVIAYSGALSSGDRSDVRGYLGAKYGITV